MVSDHGENLWEGRGEIFDHGETVYQAAIHGVCLMRLPGGELGGTRVDGPISSVEILPTLLHRLGLEIPAGIDGETVILDRPPSPRARFGEATKPGKLAETDSRWLNIRKARFVREGSFKFIQNPYRGTEELYDVASDPTERANLLDDPTPEALALAARLRRRLDAWTESAAPLPSRFEPSQREETIERLKSLGYLP